jgi:hypothetical protein
MVTPKKTTIEEFSGNATNVGSQYAQKYEREIAGFFTQEYGKYSFSKKYVASCLQCIKKDAPTLFEFLSGAAKQSLLTLEQHVLLMLHEEELYHRNFNNKVLHCTVAGAKVGATNAQSNVLLGETLDWSTAYFPWSSLNKFKIKGNPAITAISFPGLPVSAGMNSKGLSLVWTGSGYYPPLMPKVGIPTYGIIFELLLSEDVPSAIKYLKNIKVAGAFIFFLGDAKGNFCVVEGVPGKIVIREESRASRANVYEYNDTISYAKQELPGIKKCHSIKRKKVMKRSFLKASRANESLLKKVLSQKHIYINSTYKHATLWRVIADCSAKELTLCPWRGGSNSWFKIKA